MGPRGLKGVTAHALPHLNKKYKYIYISTYVFTAVSRGETKKGKKEGGAQSHGTGAGVWRFLQVLQDKGNHR
jgi:hypothetical protein